MNVERVHQIGNVVARPEKHHLVANAMVVEQADKLGIFGRDPRTDKDALEGKPGARG